MRIELTLSAQLAASLSAPGWRKAAPIGTAWTPRYLLEEPPVVVGLEEVEERRYEPKCEVVRG